MGTRIVWVDQGLRGSMRDQRGGVRDHRVGSGIIGVGYQGS